MKLQVHSRSGRKIADLDVKDNATVEEVKKQFASKSKYSVDRQRFTCGVAPGTPLVEGKRISDYNLKDGAVLVFKDLGPQISYQMVFVVEYLGPLLVYPLFYLFPGLIYGSSPNHHFVQKLALACWSVHYAKRILETLFVHRFSHATMPVFNLFKNCSYYWSFTALVSYFCNHPLYTAPPDNRVWVGLSLFVVGELVNFITHLQLRNLRPEGSSKRAIPQGMFFSMVSCPNYTFEVLSWIGFSIMCQCLTSWLFAIVGFGQMWLWAVGKHRRYKKEFDGKEGRPMYPKRRKIMIPFLL